MSVIVDTSVWSLALRRSAQHSTTEAQVLRSLIVADQAQLIGPIRQELLSGIRHAPQFERLKEVLRAFPDLVLNSEDFETAAEFFNTCRSRGVQGSATDFLICAVAVRRDFEIYTTDRDFDRYAEHLEIRQFQPS